MTEILPVQDDMNFYVKHKQLSIGMCVLVI